MAPMGSEGWHRAQQGTSLCPQRVGKGRCPSGNNSSSHLLPGVHKNTDNTDFCSENSLTLDGAAGAHSARHTLLPSATAAPAFQLVQDGGSSRDVSNFGTEIQAKLCFLSVAMGQISPQGSGNTGLVQVWELKDGISYSYRKGEERSKGS